jgi:GNAT superfamily N-acetyltransferase
LNSFNKLLERGTHEYRRNVEKLSYSFDSRILYMLTIVRKNSRSTDFKYLTGLLDLGLTETYGALQATYDKFNIIESLNTVVVARMDGVSVGCGCFKQFEKDTIEIKRMFVKTEHRGNGIATKILNELERWAVELGYSRSILETGIQQVEAIHLYKKRGYKQIGNFGQYASIETSVCFAKNLIAKLDTNH